MTDEMTPEERKKFIDGLYLNVKHCVDDYISNDKIDISEYPHSNPNFVNIQDSKYYSGIYAAKLKIYEKLEKWYVE